MLENVCIALTESLKGILVRTQREKDRCRGSLHLLRECQSSHDRSLGRNMDGEVHSNVSNRSEERVTGNQRKGDPCYKASKNLTELCSCSSVLWKIELTSSELDISLKHFPSKVLNMWLGSSWLLIVKCEMRERIYKRESLSKKELRFKDLESSQPIYSAKSENTKGVAKWRFDTEISVDQPTQQRLGTLLPDNRRKVVQKSSKLPFPSQAQSARGV